MPFFALSSKAQGVSAVRSRSCLPSLRDCSFAAGRFPSTDVLGYYLSSLRDSLRCAAVSTRCITGLFRKRTEFPLIADMRGGRGRQPSDIQRQGVRTSRDIRDIYLPGRTERLFVLSKTEMRLIRQTAHPGCCFRFGCRRKAKLVACGRFQSDSAEKSRRDDR